MCAFLRVAHLLSFASLLLTPSLMAEKDLRMESEFWPSDVWSSTFITVIKFISWGCVMDFDIKERSLSLVSLLFIVHFLTRFRCSSSSCWIQITCAYIFVETTYYRDTQYMQENELLLGHGSMDTFHSYAGGYLMGRASLNCRFQDWRHIIST